QRRRIHFKALNDVSRHFDVSLENLIADESKLNRPEIAPYYTEAYRKHYAEAVGLRLQSPLVKDFTQQVLEFSNGTLQGMISTPVVQNYLRKLNEVDRVKFIAHLAAESFADRYQKMTVSNSQFVPLDAPEQPGIFQKARQSRLAT